MPEHDTSPGPVSVFFALGCVVLGLALYIPALSAPGSSRRTANQMKNSANLRGIGQGCNQFANTHNDYLPGMDKQGEIVAASRNQTGSASNTGAAVSSRFWILLNGQYIGPDLLMNPNDSLTKWNSGHAVTSENFSYAGLQIGDLPTSPSNTNHAGRAAEWKNAANSMSVLFSDRNLGESNADSQVKATWLTENQHLFGLFVTHTREKGHWKGNIVWGDGHGEFAQSHLGFQTRYLATTTTNDNLFATTSALGVTESTSHSGANAMLVYY